VEKSGCPIMFEVQDSARYVVLSSQQRTLSPTLNESDGMDIGRFRNRVYEEKRRRRCLKECKQDDLAFIWAEQAFSLLYTELSLWRSAFGWPNNSANHEARNPHQRNVRDHDSP
jgi:hypothetical protein